MSQPVELAGLPSLASLTSLSGHQAVVTGAAGGLGKAIALRLAEAGCAVLLGDRDEGGAMAAAAAIARATNADTVGFRMDVTDAASVEAAAELAARTFGGLDIWVNN